VKNTIGWSLLTVVIVLLIVTLGAACGQKVQSAQLPTPISGGALTPASSPAVVVATPSPTPAPATPTIAPMPTPVASLDTGATGAEVSIDCVAGPPDQYQSCLATEPGGATMTFYLYLPTDYDPRAEYPLVLLLHGGGQRADSTRTAEQNRASLIYDPYAEIWGPGFPQANSADVQGSWPCFVVLPQVELPDRFVDVAAGTGSYTLAPQPNDSLRMTKEIVDTVQLMYPDIDANRRYITGLSMGGYGTWEAIERWPNYFAAAAPIAGAGDTTKAAELVDLPIWAFHGSNDTVIPVAGSRDMIEAIQAAGGNPRYTEYAGEEHGVWVNPYTLLGEPSPTPDFFAWLFAQHK
jgi:predicted peptidase